MGGLVIDFFINFISLALEAAPWLVLGLVLGGLMKVMIPTSFLQRHLKDAGISSIFKAALLGAPLPLCSCGVIPAAIGLRKGGASKPATVSFLVSTPETGIDSISITYALMGSFMAIVRPIAALFSAILTGLLVAFFDKKNIVLTNTANEAIGNSCCGNEKSKKVYEGTCSSSVKEGREHLSCCVTEAKNNVDCCSTQSNLTTKQSALLKAWKGIHYSFTQLLGDIAFWLLIGLFFAALVQTLLPPDFMKQWGSGIVAMLIMMVVGIPMYICATASTPIAAGLMLAGMSPGVALVLLLTGPATNISTLGVIAKELGRRSMVLYLAGVSITALLAGLLVDAIVQIWQLDITTALHAHHESVPVIIAWVSLLILIGAIAINKWKKRNV